MTVNKILQSLPSNYLKDLTWDKQVKSEIREPDFTKVMPINICTSVEDLLNDLSELT